MAELDKNLWLSSNTYDFIEDARGRMFLISSQTTSPMEVKEEELPNGSFTKFLLNDLKEKGKV